MKRNNFIYATAFFCGMSVMAVELSATRLLSPVYGSSQVIWTIVIGLIMISLSLGNVLGGRLADKYDNMDKLYSLIWLASIWIAIIPLIGKYIIYLTAFIMAWLLPKSLLTGGSTISCLVIFSFPLVILGMVSPYLVKFGVKDMENNGRTTGEIYALSTVGSIIGTFIPTFVTIPYVGTSKTFFIFSLVLNLLCIWYFVNRKRRIMRSAASTAVILALLLIPFNNSFAFWKQSVLYEGESLYNYLQVYEQDDSVMLSTNVAFGVQSIYKKDSILTGFYYDYALMSPYFINNFNPQQNLDMLVIGFGTGTFAKQCRSFFQNSKIEGVEIDNKIIDLSKEHFNLQESDAKVYINDGRAFLKSKDAKSYDVVMVDAYHDITIPFHMSTAEFFSEVRQHLKPGGALVININMSSNKNNELLDYLSQTVSHEFEKTYKYQMKDGMNTLVVASEDEKALDNFRMNIGKLSKSDDLYEISRYVDTNINEVTEATHVFTDDVAPVELLGQKAIDDIITEELRSFKEQINSTGKGIWGIFDLL